MKKFVKSLCVEIDMIPAKLVWWDYRYNPWQKHKDPPNIKGTSMVQFIQTSAIIIHAMDDLSAVYIDLFSCGDFDSNKVAKYSRDYFGGEIVTQKGIIRK